MTTDEPGAVPPDGATNPAPRPERLGRNTLVMAAGTGTSRVLGLVRSALLVAAVGATGSIAANAFDVGNRLPNMMFAVLAAGVLNSALVPQIVRAFRDGNTRLVHRILTLGGVGMLLGTVVLTLMAGIWVRLYAPEWGPDQTALATAFGLWCIPQLLFYGLYTLWGKVLNARGQFGAFMWAPVAANVVAIAGLVTYLVMFGPYVASDDPASVIVDEWTPLRIGVLAGFATLGIAVQALVLIGPMLKGGYRWRWAWRRETKGELTTVATVASWALGAVLIEQVAVWLTTIIATSAEDAAAVGGAYTDPSIAGNAAYAQALGVYLVPHSLVAISIMTVLFTSMARHAAARDYDAMRGVLSRGIRLVGVFAIFASTTLLITAPHVVRVLFPTLQGESVDAIAWVVRCMVLGLLPLGMAVMAKQAYFALDDGRTVFLIHLPMALAWVAVAYGVQSTTEPVWWVRGVALGLTASNIVAAVLRLAFLRRRLGGLDLRRVLSTYARAALAALVASAAGYAIVALGPTSYTDAGWSAWGTSAAMTAAAGATMGAVFVGVALALRVAEVGDATRMLTRRVRRVR